MPFMDVASMRVVPKMGQMCSVTDPAHGGAGLSAGRRGELRSARVVRPPGRLPRVNGVVHTCATRSKYQKPAFRARGDRRSSIKPRARGHGAEGCKGPTG